ncbi:hypothetical protein F503_03158 [Ophiostoma piceae UAMH 11346]|uniref:Uncharacterized protein n=1 Tax=Ophiostoma piceae (strain UAMH 11346) TaxID=1262450 RepID=S3C4I5_OPHP1|nr:hypothetical protein F503_03158 [Ophiostoma piceae UAMH 11346]
MCETAFFTHPLCGCRWLQVMQPCGPGMGLSTCPFLLSSSSTGASMASPPPPAYGLKRGTIKKIKKDFEKAKSKNNHSIFSPYAFEQVDPALTMWSRIPCPKHNMVWYDRNYTRMVVDTKNGVRWGLGPNKTDPGIECGCCVM